MTGRRLYHWMVTVIPLLTFVTLSPTTATPLTQGKGPHGSSVQDTTTIKIDNGYLKVSTSDGGRFTLGTTGGDPSTPNDDNSPLLFGYPTDAGSSFSTLRVISGSVTTDYQLGSTGWSGAGLAPIAPPVSDGSTITTTWQQEGIRVEERLYFAQDSDAAIEYTLHNSNPISRDVGLRIMLDVMIGSNDGAPFLIPGTGQVTQQSEWQDSNVPDYWMGYESPTFASDGFVGRGQLSGGDATPPDRFVVADWVQARGTAWDYTVDPADLVANDSAVILYFGPVTLQAGQAQTYRTYYGIAGTVVQTYTAYLPLVLKQSDAFPDLVVTDVVVAPSLPGIGQSATVTVTVQNQGTAATGTWFFVDVYVDPASPPDDIADLGTHFGYCPTTLEPGASCPVTFTHTFDSGGSHTLYAQVDTYDGFTGDPDYGMIQESNEANNVYGPVSLSVGSCAEGIANGGFELDGDWEVPVTKYTAAYATQVAHGGNRAMRIGIVEPADNRYSYSSARQLVVIPADVVSATLRCWLYPVSGEAAALQAPARPLAATIEEASLSGDTQYVLILDDSDRWIDTLLWQRNDDRQWGFHQFSLQNYAGRTIKLHFGVYNDGGGGSTGMYLDDVSLELCFPGGAAFPADSQPSMMRRLFQRPAPGSAAESEIP